MNFGLSVCTNTTGGEEWRNYMEEDIAFPLGCLHGPLWGAVLICVTSKKNNTTIRVIFPTLPPKYSKGQR